MVNKDTDGSDSLTLFVGGGSHMYLSWVISITPSKKKKIAYEVSTLSLPDEVLLMDYPELYTDDYLYKCLTAANQESEQTNGRIFTSICKASDYDWQWLVKLDFTPNKKR